MHYILRFLFIADMWIIMKILLNTKICMPFWRNFVISGFSNHAWMAVHSKHSSKKTTNLLVHRSLMMIGFGSRSCGTAIWPQYGFSSPSSSSSSSFMIGRTVLSGDPWDGRAVGSVGGFDESIGRRRRCESVFHGSDGGSLGGCVYFSSSSSSSSSSSTGCWMRKRITADEASQRTF